MATLTVPIDQEDKIGQALAKAAEIAALVVALLGLSGFFIVLYAILFIVAVPAALMIFAYCDWLAKREYKRLLKRMPTLTQAKKLKLLRSVGNEVGKLTAILTNWEASNPKLGFISKYLHDKIASIRDLGLASEKALVAATFPTGEAVGIGEHDTIILRENLADFEEDWDSEDMDTYDEVMAS